MEQETQFEREINLRLVTLQASGLLHATIEGATLYLDCKRTGNRYDIFDDTRRYIAQSIEKES
jgi:hypothetical protein